MMPWIAPRFRGLAGWMAAGVCASVALLTWFGYHAIREWQRSSTLLVERRADAAADLLVTALTRDMHAVQKSVLASPDWDAFTLDPPSDVGNMIASAFARYPYPESFFAARGATSAGSVIFFTRSNRQPVWAPDEEAPNRFPVTTSTVPMVAEAIMERIAADASYGRRFSIFQLPIGGQPHQVIVRLLYHDQFRENLEGIFGFTVDMQWVRLHYFPELTSQVARIGGTGSGLALSVLDAARQRRVADDGVEPQGADQPSHVPDDVLRPAAGGPRSAGRSAVGSVGGAGQRRGRSDARGAPFAAPIAR